MYAAACLARFISSVRVVDVIAVNLLLSFDGAK
nr:MAG TPA: hypothetical protein [Caudoviricetes sp.]